MSYKLNKVWIPLASNKIHAFSTPCQFKTLKPVIHFIHGFVKAYTFGLPEISPSNYSINHLPQGGASLVPQGKVSFTPLCAQGCQYALVSLKNVELMQVSWLEVWDK